jgi:hypothetical protein
MAGETKVVQQLSEEAADELVKGVRQLKAGGKLKKLAEEVGVSTKSLEKIADKGTEALEGIGKKLDDLQLRVDSIFGRAGREPTELEKLGAKAAQGGQTPPTVPPAFAKEEIAREKGYRLATPPPPQGMEGPRGGPLVGGNRTYHPNETVDPVTGAPMSTETAVVPYGSVLNKPTMTQEELSKAAAQAKPGQAGRGVSEVTPATKVARGEESRMQAERAADLGLNLDLPEIPGMPKIPKGTKRVGLGLGIAGIASGFSKEANAPTTIAAAQVDKIEDVKTLANNAEAQGAVTPEQKTVLQGQAEQLEAAAQSIEDKLTSDYEKKKARVELMQLTETIMNGLVTAIGANALLNRGSPYAVDFSKGPKTDWAGEFDRLQKDYATQMGAIMQKYKLEATEKREAERAARQESQFQQSQALKREQMEARQGQAVQTAAQKQAEKKNKLEADATGIIEKIAAFDPEKDVSKMSTSRGQLYKVTKQLFNSEELKQIEARTTELSKESESKIRAFFRSIGLASQEKTPKEYANLTNAYAQAVREKLLPEGQQAAPAAAPSDADAKRRRLEELRAKKSGG